MLVAHEDADHADIFLRLRDLHFFKQVDTLGGGAQFFSEQAVLLLKDLALHAQAGKLFHGLNAGIRPCSRLKEVWNHVLEHQAVEHRNIHPGNITL